MTYKVLKYLRIVVALCVLVAITLAFVDFNGRVPQIIDLGLAKARLPECIRIEKIASAFPVLAKIQFIPALLAQSFVVFAALVVATLLFGRVYCAVVCPLGILQDVIAWFGRLVRKLIPQKTQYKTDANGVKIPLPKRKKPWRNYEWRKNPIRIRILFLVIAILSVPVSFFFFGLIEPYGIFGRIAVNVFKPFVLWFNNDLYAYCNERELFQYGFYYIDVRPESIGALVVGILSFVALIAFAGRWGRLYCNSVCPVGTILGSLSRFSLFRVKIDQDRCVKCGLCSKACKSSCIDFKNKTVDASRCVVCFNCFGQCKKGALSYLPNFGAGKQDAPESAAKDAGAASSALDAETLREKERIQREIQSFDRGKRQFLTLSLAATTAAITKFALGDDPENAANDAPADAAEPTEGAEAKPADYGLVPYKREYTISPPGSISHRHFQNRCVGCHLCVSKCPQRILKPCGFENGLIGFMQPRLDFTHAFCNFDCTVCGEVCPAGAILPLKMEEKQLVQMGHVVFIKENCIVYAQDTSCGACSEHCPTQAIHMIPYKDNLTIPETTEELCVGCGGCEYICPARPFRAVYIEGNPVHKQAKPVEAGETKEVEDVDFGF